MKLNKIGQSLWEVVLLMALFCGIFVWMDFKKQTESNQFRDQSKQSNLVDHCTGLININCGGKEAASFPTSKSITPPEPIIVEPTAPTLEETFGVSKGYVTSIGHLNWYERLGLDVAVMLTVMAVGGLLDALGGGGFLFCRRYIMPFLIGMGASTIVYTFHPVWYAWLTVFLIMPGCGTLTLPYSGDGNFGRGAWLFINAVALGLFLLLISYFCHVHILAWWLYSIYVVVAGIWGGIYRNWEQFFGDWVTGSLGLCALILYVYLSLQFNL